MKNKQAEESTLFKPKASYNGPNGKLLQTSSMNSSATLTNSCSTTQRACMESSSMLMPQPQQQQHRLFFNSLSEHKLNNNASNKHSYLNSSTTSTEKESVKSRNISMNNESLLLSLNSLMPKHQNQGSLMREHFEFIRLFHANCFSI